ncbi:MAG: hypothetical protein CMO80_21120, partial [Verrucomicrobiales bacterium]|nr:hypothetical protein [Verrucomicrobiales bacterium]
RYYAGNPTNVFDAPVTKVEANTLNSLAFDDWDGDSLLDILFGNNASQVRAIPNTGISAFSSWTATDLATIASSLGDIFAADLDGDGKDDLVAVQDDGGTGRFSVIRNGQSEVGPGGNVAFNGRTLTFGPGETNKSFSLTVLDDLVVNSGTRTVNLQVTTNTPSSLPSGDATNSPANAQIVLVDNEIELVFAAGAVNVNEGATNATVTVNRNGDTNAVVTVDITTVASGTGIDGIHFIGASNTLTFGLGVSSLTFDIPVINNTIPSGSRTFDVVLLNPGGPFGTQLGTPNTATVTINDDDPTPIAGSRDPSFFSVFDGSVLTLDIHDEADTNRIGKLVVGGSFGTVNSITRNGLVRLNRDGSLDLTFSGGSGANGDVRAVKIQDDGQIVVGGAFTTYSSDVADGPYIVRLAPDGTVDSLFRSGANDGPNNPLNAVAIQPDGKILIGGSFTEFDGTPAPFIARLNPNGQLDLSFNTGVGPNGTVRDIEVMPNGDIVIGGDFGTVAGISSPRVAVLTTNGLVDTAFGIQLGTGPNGPVFDVAIQDGTNVVFAGQFSSVGPNARGNIARMTNGVFDLAWAPMFDGAINALHVDSDGFITVGGAFSTLDSLPRERIARLSADGALDPTINFGFGANNDVNAVLQQFFDDHFVVGGAFTEFDRLRRDRLVRLHGRGNLGPGNISFAETNYIHAESINATITLRREGGLQGTVSAQVNTADGTATAGADYASTSQTMVFTSGEFQKTLLVPQLEDLLVEGNETVNLSLSNPQGGAGLGTIPTATQVIRDNDSTLMFRAPEFTVAESTATGVVHVARLGGLEGVVTVGIQTTVNGTATAGSDFVATNDTITFTDGQTNVSFEVIIIDDIFVEGTESVDLALANPGGQGSSTAVLGANDTASLNIVDDDFAPGTLQFTATDFVVSEDGTNLIVVAERTAGSLGQVFVDFTMTTTGVGIGHATPGVDHGVTNGTLSWADGVVTPQQIIVPLVDDGLVEGTETLLFQLSNPQNGALLGISNATAHIVDNDGVVQFQIDMSSVSETAGTASILVTRSGAVANDVDVIYATTNTGTATPSIDFTPRTGTLDFTPGLVTTNIDVAIIDDTLAEPAETIVVTLFQVVGNAFLGSRTNHVVSILDNDISLQFLTNAFVVNESVPNASITITRSGDPNQTVAVTYSTTDNSATAALDYQPANGVLTFNPTETVKTFTIGILPDGNVEGNEVVNLDLSLPTGGAVLGPIPSATLTITDDDTSVSITPVATVTEGQTATITVVRGGLETTAFQVNFEATDGTAVAPADYTATNGILNFGAGEIVKTFTVPTQPNSVASGDKTVNLRIFNPTSGVELGSNPMDLLVIKDDEVFVEFAQPALSFLESPANVSTQVFAEIIKLGALESNVNVNVTMLSAGATPGVDFVAFTSDFNIPSGASNVFIPIQLLEETPPEAELDELALLRINSVSNGAIGTTVTNVVTIVDDERVGSIDSDFAVDPGADNTVDDVALYPFGSPHFGKAIIVGDFQEVNGTNAIRVARLNADGTLDTGFGAGLIPNNFVSTVAILPTDEILIGGGFTAINGVAQSRFARLTPTGTLDTNYNNGNAISGAAVLDIHLQSDGKALLGGVFSQYDGNQAGNLVRVNADGAYDNTFTSSPGADSAVYALEVVDATGDIYVGGLFNSINGLAQNRIARLNSAGTADAGFNPVLGGATREIRSIIADTNDVLIAGAFTGVGVQTRTNIARLLLDGTVDPSFAPATFADSTIRSMALDSFDRIFIGGAFDSVNGQSRSGIARIQGDGSLDITFLPGNGFNGVVRSLEARLSGRVLVGGVFTEKNGITRHRVAQLNGDPGQVEVDVPVLASLERNTNVVISMHRFDGLSGSLTVDFTLVSADTNALPGVDFVATNGQATFAPGQTNLSVTVHLIHDQVPEASEIVNFQLTAAQGGFLGAATNTAITIQDDDSIAEFDVTSTNVSVLENVGTVTLDLTRTGITDTTLTVDYRTMDGTALNAVDYAGATNSVVFGVGVTSASIGIEIFNDQLLESDRDFFLQLLQLQLNQQASLGLRTNAQVTILNNDSSFDLTPTTHVVAENIGSVAFTVNRTGYAGNSVDVNYSTADGLPPAGAQDGSDYNALAGTVTFAATETSKPLSINILNDKILEPVETFTFSLTGAVGEGTLGTQTVATVTINDNDSLFSFTTPAVTVNESDGVGNPTIVPLTISRTGNVGSSVTLPVNTVNGTAFSVLDYNALTASLIFGPGQVSTNISVVLVNDTVVETSENLTVDMGVPIGEAALGAIASTVINIDDDDSSLGFEIAATTNSENTGVVNVVVTRTGNVNSQVRVGYQMADGTARAGEDYVSQPGELTFNAGVTSQTIPVTLLNDQFVEGQEQFSIVLVFVTLGQANVNPAAMTFNMVIDDDDSSIRFTQSTISRVERNTNVLISVERVGNLTGSVSADYFYTTDNAFINGDFVATTGTVVFADGQSTATITNHLINDQIVDQPFTNRESFFLNLTNAVGESSVGTPNQIRIDILDDDALIEFISTNFVALESIGTANGILNVDVSRQRDFGSEVRISYSFGTNLSAVPGVDFDPTAGTGELIFGTNVTNQTIQIPLFNDTVLESNKIFTVTLHSPQGEAAIGPRGLTTVTIQDDDSEVNLPNSFIPLPESFGRFTFSITRFGDTNLPVSVDVVPIDYSQISPAVLSTTVGQDYPDLTTTLTFGPGEISKDVSLDVIDDMLEEGIEQLKIVLTNFSGEVTNGVQSDMDIQISDNDFRIIRTAGWHLVSESFLPTNNAIDPGETVTVALGLRNLGNVGGINVTGRLLNANGVINASPPVNYASIPTGNVAVSNLFTFTAGAVPQIRAQLELSDSEGLVTEAGQPLDFLIDLGVPYTFDNSALITIPETVSVPAVGKASPYPATISVTGVEGLVNRVKVKLNRLTHTWPADLDILLVAPSGQSVLLMSDAGSGNSVNNATLTFDDNALLELPNEAGLIVSTSYRPTDYAPQDFFPAPAPQGPYTNGLNDLSGINPNGTWSLYVYDDTDLSFGNLLEGWSLELNSVNGQADVAANTVVAPNPASIGPLSFQTTITNNGPNLATSVIFTNVLPAGLTLQTAQSTVGTATTPATNAVLVSIGDLPVGTNVFVTVTALAATNGVFTVAGRVSSADVDVNQGNNNADATVVVAQIGTFGLIGLRQPDDSFQVTLTNAFPGRVYTFQSTTNPGSAAVWTSVAVSNAVGTTVIVVDTNAVGQQRLIYRAREN